MTTLEVRRAQRRAALLAVGVDLLGAPDRPVVNVRAVCTRASLTERYFYESFGDRDTYVRTVYLDVAEQAKNVLISAVGHARRPDERARRAVAAFTTLVLDEPARGRVLLTAPFADPALSHLGVGAIPSFVALVGAQLPPAADDVDRHLVATGVVGALTGLFTAYLGGALVVERQRFVDHCVALLVSAYRGLSDAIVD